MSADIYTKLALLMIATTLLIRTISQAEYAILLLRVYVQGDKINWKGFNKFYSDVFLRYFEPQIDKVYDITTYLRNIALTFNLARWLIISWSVPLVNNRSLKIWINFLMITAILYQLSFLTFSMIYSSRLDTIQNIAIFITFNIFLAIGYIIVWCKQWSQSRAFLHQDTSS